VSYAIRCENLHKQYPGKPPVHAVRGIDLEVRTGECFGVLGPNGAGKTTTIEIFEGLMRPTNGVVEVLGHHWGRGDVAIRRRMGVSLQETRLPERLTVRELLTLFRSFYPRGPKPEAVMRLVSLEEKADSWTEKLSGGQKQRLAVACALAGDPELLFLDEPTTGLDPQSRRQLWQIIREFRSLGRTVLLTTHYMEEAERLCDRVAIIDHGRVIACDSPRALIATLGGEHVIEFSLATDGADVAAPLRMPSEEVLLRMPSVRRVQIQREHVTMTVEQPHVVLPELLEHLGSSGFPLASLTTRHASLEDVFVSITGRQFDESDENGQPASAA